MSDFVLKLCDVCLRLTIIKDHTMPMMDFLDFLVVQWTTKKRDSNKEHVGNSWTNLILLFWLILMWEIISRLLEIGNILGSHEVI